MKTVVVGFDGSEPSRNAARMAADVASKFKATVVLVFAVPPPTFPAGTWGPALEAAERSLRADSDQMLKRAAQAIARDGLTVETELLDGHPAHRIAKYAEEHRADLIVVGYQGRNSLGEALLGSVADRLLHLAPVPVLVVR